MLESTFNIAHEGRGAGLSEAGTSMASGREPTDNQIAVATLVEHWLSGANTALPPDLRTGEAPLNEFDADRWVAFVNTAQNSENNHAAQA